MIRSMVCLLSVLARIVRRLSVFENNESIAHGLEKIRRSRPRCVLCRQCLLSWYLVHAVKMKDPYRISEIYRLLDKDRDLKGISNEIREYLTESEAWIYVEKREVAISNHSAYSAADIIGMWRKGMLTSSDDDKIRKVTSRLYWPIQIIKASRLEERGQLNAAWHSYGQALKAMPSWIPDAKTLLDKINNLRTYKDQ